jgi:hypothetical protein
MQDTGLVKQPMRPGTHPHWQSPPVQTVPGAHAMPHPPQFSLSLDSFAQNITPASEAQRVNPAPPHGGTHVPLVQTVLPWQAWPHAPQLPSSVWGLVQ